MNTHNYTRHIEYIKLFQNVSIIFLNRKFILISFFYTCTLYTIKKESHLFRQHDYICTQWVSECYVSRTHSIHEWLPFLCCHWTTENHEPLHQVRATDFAPFHCCVNLPQIGNYLWFHVNQSQCGSTCSTLYLSISITPDGRCTCHTQCPAFSIGSNANSSAKFNHEAFCWN